MTTSAQLKLQNEQLAAKLAALSGKQVSSSSSSVLVPEFIGALAASTVHAAKVAPSKANNIWMRMRIGYIERSAELAEGRQLA